MANWAVRLVGRYAMSFANYAVHNIVKHEQSLLINDKYRRVQTVTDYICSL